MNNKDGAMQFDAWIQTDEFKKQAEEVKAGLTGIRTTAVKEADGINNTFANIAKGAAAAFTFDAALNFRSKLIEVRGEFQKYEAVLTNSMGSQKDASAAMQMLTDIASKTPFQLDSLTGSYVKLVNQGFIPTREEIVKLGDLASSTGKGFDQLAEAILDAQTGQFERLKEFGIKASASGDQVSFSFKGVTTTVANSSEEIRKYMLSLGEMKGVQGSMDAISKTLVGQMSNLEDSITAMFNSIGQSSEGFLSDSIAATKFLVDNYAEIGKIIGVLVASYGAYKAAVITTTVVERAREAALLQTALAGRTVSTWEAFHIGVLKKAQAAQMMLNNTMLANPFVLAAAAIAGVITYLVLFKEKTDDITQAQREFKETSEKSTAEVTALFDQLKRTNAGTEERKKIIEQLNGKYGEYLHNMNLEAASLLDIEKAQKAVSNAMLERMATEGKTKDLTDITERKLATLKTIQAKSTKSEYAEILSYIEEGSKAATYTFDQATGKLKSNTVFKSWGKDIDNLMLSLEAIKQQEKAVN
ncbi:MAG: tape measure protein, partial [Bacteroidales bacterium]